MSAAMRHPAPRAGREAEAHWQAAAEGRLLLPFSLASHRPVWPPSAAHGALEWRAVAPGGTVVGVSVVRRAVQPEWQGRGPYVVAMVALDAGVRLFGNVVDCPPEAVAVGTRVVAGFVPTMAAGLGLVVFRPEAVSPAAR